jgi:hypothetical protein
MDKKKRKDLGPGVEILPENYNLDEDTDDETLAELDGHDVPEVEGDEEHVVEQHQAPKQGRA